MEFNLLFRTVTKPVTGVFDFTSKTLLGVSSSVGPKAVDRVRMPRHFGRGGVIENFEEKHKVNLFSIKYRMESLQWTL